MSAKKLPLEGFDTPPGMILDPNNRWVTLRDCIPWDELSESYYKTLCSSLGRPAKVKWYRKTGQVVKLC